MARRPSPARRTGAASAPCARQRCSRGACWRSAVLCRRGSACPPSDAAGRKIRGLLGSCLQRAGRMLPRCSARVVARTALAVLRVRACSPTAVAALRTEAPNSERANLFVRKLRLCSVICDFSDGGGNDRDKEIKRQVCKLHACLLFPELDQQRVWFPCLTTFAGADAPRACGLCQQRKTVVRRADHAGSCCNG